MEEQLLKEFTEHLRRRYSIDTESMSMSDWIETNTTLRKKPFSLKEYEFQRQIADDLHPNMTVIKPSQVGLTEIQIRKALAWLKRNDGTSLIYSMPNDEMRSRMSQTRVRPIVEYDSVFQTEFDDEAVRQKGLMQFGQSFLYMTGAKEGDATSLAADFVMNDEVDLTNERMVALFRSRLQGSKYKINQKFSTPTYPKTGVSKDYAESDKHEYAIKCDGCNHWQVPLFTRDFCRISGLGDTHQSLVDEIDLENVQDLDLRGSYIACENCHAPLDLGNPDLRSWVAERPAMGDIARGYRVRPFSVNNLDIRYIVRELIEAKKRSTLRGFYNTVLGEAYIDDSIALNDEIVRDALGNPTSWVYQGQPCFLGIDMGLNCHLVVGTYSNTDGWIIFHWDVVPATKIVSYVSDLLPNYNIVGGAVDRFPYTPTAIDIRSISNGRIVPVEYRGLTELNVKENEQASEETYAQVNRTAILDEEAKLIRSHRMKFVNYDTKRNLIIRQLTDNVRHEEADIKPVWKKQTGDDHFFHAIAFMLAGKKLQDYINMNAISDVRSMVTSVTVDLKSNPYQNLYGARSKRLTDNEIGFRL